MSDADESRVAYLEEAADKDSGSSLEVVEGTRTYARSGRVKERPNTGKSRADRPSPARKMHDSLTSLSPTGADSTDRDSEGRRRPTKLDHDDRERERRRREKKRRDAEEAAYQQAKADARAAKEYKNSSKSRAPSSKPSPSRPVVSQGEYRRPHAEDASYFGVGMEVPAPSSARPRANTRPKTYYGGQYSGHPPIANVGWHQSHPAPFPVGTYPPPMYGGPPPPSQFGPMSPMSPIRGPGHYDSGPGPESRDHLKDRFTLNRPSSAMGYQGRSPGGYPRDERVEALSRRPSRKQKDDRSMPPPDFIPKRTHSAAIPNTPFRPPPQPLQRGAMRSQTSRPSGTHKAIGFVDQGYDDDDFLGEDDLFQDVSPDPAHGRRRAAAMARSHRKSGNFDQEYEVTPASRRLRASMYGTGALGAAGVSLEDNRVRDAMEYQQQVGGPQMPLTAETLRRANKGRGEASSRSTRSSESRDYSDYKRSSATGITRSSSGDKDDLTIKLTGAAVIKMGGAEIECDGGEIVFNSRPAGSRSTSDQASSMYQIEDARSRVERKALPHRARAPSQSDSQSRGHGPRRHAPYDPAFAPTFAPDFI